MFSFLTSLAVSAVERIIMGRKQGEKKKDIAMAIIQQILTVLAQKQVVASVQSKEEISSAIDAQVAQFNATGQWPALENDIMSEPNITMPKSSFQAMMQALVSRG